MKFLSRKSENPFWNPSNHHNTAMLHIYHKLRTTRSKPCPPQPQNLGKFGAENSVENKSTVGSGGKFPEGSAPWLISPDGCKPPIQFHPVDPDGYITEIRQTLKERYAPGNAIPSHSVEVVKFCIECSSSPSNGSGGAKNSWTFNPCIDDGDPPEDPSPVGLCASSAWIWLIGGCATSGVTGYNDDLIGEVVPDANEDEFLDVGFRVRLGVLTPGYGASSLTVASRPFSNLE